MRLLCFCFLFDVRRKPKVVSLLSNDLSSSINYLSSVSGNTVNNCSSSVNNLFDYAINSLESAVNCLSSSSSLTATRCERDSHSGNEHKCNLFHFLFCFLNL